MNLANRCVIVAGLKSRSSSGRPPQRERSSEGGPRRDGGERPERGPRRERGDRGGRGDRGERPANEVRASMPVSDPGPMADSVEPSVGKAAGALSPIGEFVLGLIERLEAGPFELAESGENETIAIRLSGAAAQTIAAGDARTIDAIQLLANQVSMRDGDDAKRVVVEAEGDLARRESTRTARRARGERARDWPVSRDRSDEPARSTHRATSRCAISTASRRCRSVRVSTGRSSCPRGRPSTPRLSARRRPPVSPGRVAPVFHGNVPWST